jgi:hypothetical protein
MAPRTRREFLNDVGRGMFVAGLGTGLAADLGLTPKAFAAEEPAARLTFGELEPLVGLMQDTPAAKLLPLLVKKLEDGTSLKDLLRAATFANARTFGGEDYVGFHTLMALAPAWHMANELPKERQALPVLKVLYRNTNRIQEYGGAKNERLKPVEPGELPEGKSGGAALLEQCHRKDIPAADRTFAALMKHSTEEGFNELLVAVQDEQEVHRVVLPYRAWAMLDIVGKEHALTMLRQSVHYCAKNYNPKWNSTFDGIRTQLPKLMDQYKLPRQTPGTRTADDAWMAKMTDTLFAAKPADAAEAAAAALAEGFAAAAVAEAVALAANQLVLRDGGRPANQTSPGKPLGSVHGDSIGVHACDSANAWRNLARVSNPRNSAACIILSAYQMARDRGERGGTFFDWKPLPHAEQREAVTATEPAALLKEAEAAIRANDQAKACAVTARYGELGHQDRPLLDLLLKYSISEEGALHAEKYYRTCTEEYGLTRPAFRWRQIVALSRVVASEYGTPAAGYAEMCKLLKV